MSAVYIFFGPPGSGKGSLAQQCVRALGWQSVSTGNLCRNHIARKTSLGQEIDFFIKSGKLIPDQLITAMVEELLIEMLDNKKTIILDGYPRTLLQAEALHNFFSNRFHLIRLHLVALTISDGTIIERLTGRLICENKDCQAVYSDLCKDLGPLKNMVCNQCDTTLTRRSDDDPAVITERLNIYRKYANELLDFFKRNKQDIFEIDSSQSPHNVFSDFKRLVGITLHDNH